MRTLFSILLCAGLLCAAGASRRAPGFSLPDTRGQQHDLADYRGKVVILEFMQTSCPHCGGFAEILARVQQRYGDRVAILSVANPPDDARAISNFIASHRIAYPVLMDCGQMAYSYLRTQSFNIPHVYLIDPNGAIVDDIEYSNGTADIFEGNGFFPRLEAVLKGSAGKR